MITNNQPGYLPSALPQQAQGTGPIAPSALPLSQPGGAVVQQSGRSSSVQTPPPQPGAGGALQPASRQLSYEQFQEQVRQRQQQEEQMARMALLQAGADSRSEKLRSLAVMLQGVRDEVKLAENQLQVQMDAQRRQFSQIASRISQMEAQIAETIRQPRDPLH